ncbi:hypothetical protein B0T19DRAFT_389209 [Cercophora scortea]|uniref:Galactose oxidase n=1 Tax=Cercophora scortea TaxID=314031 RepID=A0AAE0M5R3_9PEZI|nr:hypothetical protein B0T19DRAFT_389209 [Cercophora scortea]
MAEVAAGAIVAEQVVATGVEAGAAVAIASPTQPLKVSLSQLAASFPDDTSHALSRSHHTVTVIDNTAYIFGGQLSSGALCPPDIHVITLATPPTHTHYPAFPFIDATTGETYIPSPRTRHAACAHGTKILIHGGCDASGTPIPEPDTLWVFDTRTLQWSRLPTTTQLNTTLAPRYGHTLSADPSQDLLILHGGRTGNATDTQLLTETETWLFDFSTRAFTTLPPSPSPSLATALANRTLYTIARSDSPLSGTIHYLPLLNSTTEREKPDALAWKTVTYPTNPLTPGPRPRAGGALVPLHTGLGRSYLVYMFGCLDSATSDPAHAQEKEEKETPHYADIWALQLPSQGFTAAHAKDAIRDKLLPAGVTSGEFSWAEVEIVPTEQAAHEGKVHPGPRGLFGAAAECLGGKGVVFWGGVNAKGEREGDGWLLKLAYGAADDDRWE